MRTVPSRRGGTAVFFFTALSPRLTPARLAALLAPLGPDPVDLATANLRRLRAEHPGLAVVSVRELFAGAEARLRSRAQALFRRAGLLRRYGRPEGAGPESRRAAARYGGAFPPGLAPGAARWLFARMADIRDTAAAVLHEGLALSSSHVVLSARHGDFLTITATDTDKRQVQLFSQTPLVTKRTRAYVYYGDPAFAPSSETAAHWELHRALGPAGACLLHFHHAGLRDAACPGEMLSPGGVRIPCVAPRPYGTPAQGRELAAALRRARAGAVTVAGHGTWFAAPSFAAALTRARRAVAAWETTPSAPRGEWIDARREGMLQLKKSRQRRGARA
jgi:ribulose-5-phosphate 4-epimerase/fuculose-1-phosphate aldolase